MELNGDEMNENESNLQQWIRWNNSLILDKSDLTIALSTMLTLAAYDPDSILDQVVSLIKG